MNGLLDAAKQAAAALFDTAVSNLDRNADGSLDINDLPPGLRHNLLSNLDTNGDGSVDALDLVPLLQDKLDVNGDGFIDLHDIMNTTQIDRLAALNITRYGDLNHDGVIDTRDLPEILSQAGTISFSSLPGSVRDRLIYALDRNHDGTLSMEDVQPVLDSLHQSAVGTHILQNLGDGNGHYSFQQLFITLNALENLRTHQARVHTDGTLDLSQLPPGLKRALLADLDSNHDGKLTYQDLDPLLTVLNSRRDQTSLELIDLLDRDGDGVITVDDVPPSLVRRIQALDHDGNGYISIDELTPSELNSLSDAYAQSVAAGGLVPPSPPYPGAPPLPPLPSSPPQPAGNDVLIAVLVIFVISIVCGVGWVVTRCVVRRKRSIETKHMLGPDVSMPSSTACSYVPSSFIPAQYNAPIAVPSPLAETTSSTSDALPASASLPAPEEQAANQTKNTGALARARAANATVSFA